MIFDACRSRLRLFAPGLELDSLIHKMSSISSPESVMAKNAEPRAPLFMRNLTPTVFRRSSAMTRSIAIMSRSAVVFEFAMSLSRLSRASNPIHGSEKSAKSTVQFSENSLMALAASPSFRNSMNFVAELIDCWDDFSSLVSASWRLNKPSKNDNVCIRVTWRKSRVELLRGLSPLEVTMFPFPLSAPCCVTKAPPKQHRCSSKRRFGQVDESSMMISFRYGTR
mmetsp:Transcript_24177/g.67026  ORF Transcript_24177/g.67026 Transcript_24177/m.67026 type:complete len:224 (-) Transcript_24177:165-836(-)